MRGLEKPQPPANVAPDTQEPRSFVEAELEYLAVLEGRPNKVQFARTEYDQLHKAKLREVMYREQGCICIYCEQRLAEGASPPRVEHWVPLSAAPELAIHWDNLYLSCTTNDTCDGSKARRRLRAKDTDPDLPWPTEFEYERVVAFTTAGRMYVRNDVHVDETTRNALELAIDREASGRRRGAILNLNHPRLLEARRAALDSERERLMRQVGQRTPTEDDRAVRAMRILDQHPLPEHVSIRVAWLLDTLGYGL